MARQIESSVEFFDLRRMQFDIYCGDQSC